MKRVKDLIWIVWVLLFGALIYIVYKAYLYLRDEFADDVAKETTDNMREFSIRDWATSLFSFRKDGGVLDWLFGKSDKDGGVIGTIFGWFGGRSKDKGMSALEQDGIVNL